MAEPVLHEGQWWVQHDNGSWSQWDARTEQWVGATQSTYRPVATLGRAVLFLIVLGIGLDSIGFFSGLAEYSLLNRAAEGEFISASEANSNDQRQALIGMLQLTLYVVTAIVFVIWFHRAYKNVTALGGHRRYGTGWAIGGWFVPFLNLVRPKQITDDIWLASDPDRTTGDLYKKGVPVFVHLWWAAWIIASILGQIAFRAVPEGNDIDSLKTSSALITASDTVNVVLGILAAMLVASITKRQELRAARAAETQPG